MKKGLLSALISVSLIFCDFATGTSSSLGATGSDSTAYCAPMVITSNDPPPAEAIIGFTFGLADAFETVCGSGNARDHQGYLGLLSGNSFGDDLAYTSQALLQPCSSSLTMFCIEEVDSRKLGEKIWAQGSTSAIQPLVNPVKQVLPPRPMTGTNFDAGSMSGGTSNLWDLPGAAHGGGNSYLVSLAIRHIRTTLSLKQTPDWSFQFQIDPLELGPSRSLDYPDSTANPSDFKIYDFPPNIEYQIRLRWDEAIIPFTQTWLYGRVNYFVAEYNSHSHELTLSGSPISVPIARLSPVPLAKVPFSLVPENARYTLQDIRIYEWITSSGFEGNPNIAQAFNAAEKIGASTVATRTYWTVRRDGSSSNLLSILPRCSNSGGGYSMNNATMFYAGVPLWNSRLSTLDYRVASTHLDQFKNRNLGYFKMAIDRRLASCLWGGNPESAQVDLQVIDLNGNEERTAVTSSSFDSNYFYFTATNFTYSSPVVRVHLTFSKQVITCTKGKIVKRVVGAKPKCPSGYKQKGK